MKRKFSFLVFTFILSFTLFAQDTPSPYLFDEFQDGYVVYKDGRKFSVKLNFNLVTGKYLFKEKTDSLEKEFTEPEMVLSMLIDDRTFLMSAGKATELIQVNPRFLVYYIGLKKKAPDKISYGGTSETASVDSYTSLAGKGLISGVRENNRIIADVHKTYKVQVGKRNRNFYNKRTFLRIFPKQKRPIIESYIDEKEVNFDSVEQVFALYQYVISL